MEQDEAGWGSGIHTRRICVGIGGKDEYVRGKLRRMQRRVQAGETEGNGTDCVRGYGTDWGQGGAGAGERKGAFSGGASLSIANCWPVAAYFVSDSYFHSEPISIVSAFAAAIFLFFFVKLLDNALKNSKKCEIRITKVLR